MGRKILVTGKNSYIGDSFSSYASAHGDCVCVVDTISDEWKNTDFSGYDAVLHVAAIVHKQNRKYTEQECFDVNTNLAFEVAKKAKESKVKQFVFISTMSVYGVVNGVITKDTLKKPFNIYGETKLKAEQMLKTLCDENFAVTIVRPPLVYGKGCKGNYNELANFAKKHPFFPDYESHRSMIYIDNLSGFIKKSIDEELSGEYCPQDDCFVKTSEMVKLVANANGRKIRMTKFFNPLITLALKLKIGIICKVFGSLTYEKDLCPPFEKVDLQSAIKFTEE